MTCAEIRTQLNLLLQKRDRTYTDWTTAIAEIRDDPAHKAAWEKRRDQADIELKAIDAQLVGLKAEFDTQCPAKQPQKILDITYINPSHSSSVDALYAQAVALGHQNPSIILGGTFPSRDAKQEWKQVLPTDLQDVAAHDADYEGPNLVGAVGWALKPEFSSADFPFDHPFGFDWEFMLALDQPVGDENRYTFLLTPADQSCNEESYKEAVSQANSLKDREGAIPIPSGPDNLPNLLGVEIDGGLVPRQFSDRYRGGVLEGDRVAVFGRWIVDCGHQMPIERCGSPKNVDVHPGLEAFRTEIHPPLLMAAARVTDSILNPENSSVTRVMFTSRPYLVGQRYSVDTTKINDDEAPDDGPFLVHVEREVSKVVDFKSNQVEAHPKIKTYPFMGAYELHFTVRPPPPVHQHPVIGPPIARRLHVSYHFAVRTGCNVRVAPGNDSDSLEVIVTLHQGEYVKPPFPTRDNTWPDGRKWTSSELGQLNKDGRTKYLEIEYIAAGISGLIGGPITFERVREILDAGVLTDVYKGLDEYGVLNTDNIFSGFSDQLEAALPNQGITRSDAQLFPIIGWLEVNYGTEAPVHG